MNKEFQSIIEAYGKKKNIAISMLYGASVLVIENKTEIWLECPDYSSLAVIHTEVKKQADFQKNTNFWKKCVEINSNTEEMEGSWLSMHNKTNTLRLCLALPKKFLDTNLLDEVIEKIYILSNDFENRYLFNY